MATSASESGFVDNWQGEKTLAECNLHMLKTQDGCDVNFLVGPNQATVRAHSYILTSRSCVFHAMFYGPMAEKERVIIPDVTDETFTEFLKFLYTDDCALSADNVTAVLYLSKKYAVDRLQKCCLRYLERHLTAENACVVLDQAHLYDEKNLQDKALDVIKQNGEVCLKSPGFRELSKRSFDMVLPLLDSESTFQAALEWADAECERTGKDASPSNKRLLLGESIHLIGFTGFDVKMFVKSVLPAGVLLEKEIIQIMSYLTCQDVDVKPFRVVNRQPDVHKLEVYTHSHIPKQNEFRNITSNSIADKFTFEADFDMYLQRIDLTPFNGTYAVTIAYETNDSQFAIFSSNVTQSQIECAIPIRANTECDIEVILAEGRCPDKLLTNLQSNCQLENVTSSLRDRNLNPTLLRAS